MFNVILMAMYFFLPAYIANMAPVLLKKVNFLNKPISVKKFGMNKTWRGLVFASLIGTLVFWLQQWLFQFSFFNNISLIKYPDHSILLGLLLGLGAIVGDLMESYYKRKAGIEPGKSWMPWDQLDFVFGGVLFSFFIYVPPAKVILVLLIFSPLLHIIVNHIGYWLKINQNKW